MKILNLNLWNKNYYWQKRKPIIVSLLEKYKLNGTATSDVLTFQEILQNNKINHLAELNQHLNYKNQIFFPAKSTAGMGLLTNLQINRQQIFKFTQNPQDPRDTFPRIIAMLELQNQNKKFILGITHFAVKAISHIRNAKESLSIIKNFNPQNLPILINGDFNCAPNEPTAQLYKQTGFADIWVKLKLPEFPSWPTEKQLIIDNKILRDGKPPDFEIEPRRIDYIWTKGFTPISIIKIGKKQNQIWHSDHWGILAKLQLNQLRLP